MRTAQGLGGMPREVQRKLQGAGRSVPAAPTEVLACCSQGGPCLLLPTSSPSTATRPHLERLLHGPHGPSFLPLQLLFQASVVKPALGLSLAVHQPYQPLHGFQASLWCMVARRMRRRQVWVAAVHCSAP